MVIRTQMNSKLISHGYINVITLEKLVSYEFLLHVAQSCAYMSHADTQRDRSSDENGDADEVAEENEVKKIDHMEELTEQAETGGDASRPTSQLEEVREQIDLTDCDELTPLGIYSIHEHQTSRAITLPQGADGFDDVTTVRQYCYDDGDQKFLIVAPLDI